VGKRYKKKKVALCEKGESVEIKKPEPKPKPEGYVFGRPTLYRPEFCEMLIEHCREGGSIEAFAGTIMVSIDALYDWFDKHEDFRHAKKIGYSLSLAWWENMGRQNIMNIQTTSGYGSYKETTSKSINSSIWIYTVKCRFRKQYTEVQKIKQIVDETSKQTQTIKIAYVPKSKRLKNNE